MNRKLESINFTNIIYPMNYFFINLQFLIFSENTRTLCSYEQSCVTFEVHVQIVNCLLLVMVYIDADTVK